MALILKTAPASEPISVSDAKAMLGIGEEVSDTAMGVFLIAARQMIDGADGWLNRCLIEQTWQLTLDRFPFADHLHEHGFRPEPLGWPSHYRHHHWHRHDAIVIPLAPVQASPAVVITYLDADGAQHTLDPSNYTFLPGEPTLIVRSPTGQWPETWWQPEAVTVEFTAGYGADATKVPNPLIMAIALQASHLRSLSAQNLYIGAETVEGIGSTNYVVGSGAGAAIDAAVMALAQPYRMILP